MLSTGLDPVIDQDAFYTSVEQHFLFSKLGESTDPGTGFACDGAFIRGDGITKKPLLVEVTDVTDIGISAYDLIISWHRRFTACPGVHPPNYPRATLKVKVSDGHEERTAVEMRYMPNLILGETPLGTKVMSSLLLDNGIH